MDTVKNIFAFPQARGLAHTHSANYTEVRTSDTATHNTEYTNRFYANIPLHRHFRTYLKLTFDTRVWQAQLRMIVFLHVYSRATGLSYKPETEGSPHVAVIITEDRTPMRSTHVVQPAHRVHSAQLVPKSTGSPELSWLRHHEGHKIRSQFSHG